MILKKDYNALVLVGLWNKSIFNPEWISRFLLPKVKSLSAEYPLNINASPRISSDTIRIIVIGNNLNFIPIDTSDETFELIQELAIKIADYLPHTPVTAFGANFLFETTATDVSTPMNKLLQLNDVDELTEFGASIKSSQHKHSMEIDKKLINLSISTDNSKRIFDFNFHFNISSLAEFKEQINSNSLMDLREIALSLMKEVYNLELKK